MTDFREELYIQQISKHTFAYCWDQIDSATGEFINSDWEQECSYKEMMSAVCQHGFDADRVHNHFLDNPCDSMMLAEEY